MAYIGKKVEETDLTNRTVDTMVGDGSDTTLTLSATPISVNNVLVFINGIMQRPTTDYTISGTTLTFGTAPFTGGIVVAITGGGEHIGVPLAKIATDKISDGAVTSAKINSLSASKITGALPALDGSALTGISAVNNITKSASDPTISSNPSSGLGTVWANTTSGETYVLTDATAGANVWTNVGPGAGDVAIRIAGYVAGGGSDVSAQKTINRFTFGSMSGSTDHGDLTVVKSNPSGASSATHGFVSGAFSPSSTVIDRFSFSTAGNSTDVGDLTDARGGGAGTHSATQGFVTGGNVPPNYVNSTVKFTFSSSVTTSSHGTISVAKAYSAGISSSTHGFLSGGYSGGTTDYNTIDKFAFASSGTYSTTDGYTSGGYQRTPGSFKNTIDKFSFASNAGATDHGDLTAALDSTAGMSSTTHGYAAANQIAGYVDVVNKFSFGSSNNATAHGNLVGRTSTYNAVGTHF